MHDTTNSPDVTILRAIGYPGVQHRGPYQDPIGPYGLGGDDPLISYPPGTVTMTRDQDGNYTWGPHVPGLNIANVALTNPRHAQNDASAYPGHLTQDNYNLAAYGNPQPGSAGSYNEVSYDYWRQAQDGSWWGTADYENWGKPYWSRGAYRHGTWTQRGGWGIHVAADGTWLSEYPQGGFSGGDGNFSFITKDQNLHVQRRSSSSQYYNHFALSSGTSIGAHIWDPTVFGWPATMLRQPTMPYSTPWTMEKGFLAEGHDRIAHLMVTDISPGYDGGEDYYIVITDGSGQFIQYVEMPGYAGTVHPNGAYVPAYAFWSMGFGTFLTLPNGHLGLYLSSYWFDFDTQVWTQAKTPNGDNTYYNFERRYYWYGAETPLKVDVQGEEEFFYYGYTNHVDQIENYHVSRQTGQYYSWQYYCDVSGIPMPQTEIGGGVELGRRRRKVIFEALPHQLHEWE